METYEIVGTHSFASDIINLKVGDKVKLIHNPDNKINPKSIGIYTDRMRKIGYLPFTIEQVTDLDEPCTISVLRLIGNKSQIIIERKIKNSNFLLCEPEIIKNLRNKKIIKSPFDNDLYNLKIHLFKNKNIVEKIGVTFYNDDYIDIYIKTNNSESIFNTVTRQYYDKNILKYDEFNKVGLIPKNIFIPYQIHRLENYIKINYNLISPTTNNNKIYSVKKIHEPLIDILKESTNDNIKIIIKNIISNNNNNHTDKLLKLKDNLIFFNKFLSTEKQNSLSFDLGTEKKSKNFLSTEIMYNHEKEEYCYIDLYNDEHCVIIDIDTKIKNYNNILNFIEPKKLYIYNPYNGNIYY